MIKLIILYHSSLSAPPSMCDRNISPSSANLRHRLHLFRRWNLCGILSPSIIQVLNRQSPKPTPDTSDIVPKAVSNKQPACIVWIAEEVDTDGDEHHAGYFHDSCRFLVEELERLLSLEIWRMGGNVGVGGQEDGRDYVRSVRRHGGKGGEGRHGEPL